MDRLIDIAEDTKVGYYAAVLDRLIDIAEDTKVGYYAAVFNRLIYIEEDTKLGYYTAVLSRLIYIAEDTKVLISLIGVIMFIYHGCDNLKHPFPTSLAVQEFSQLSSLFLKMFRFPALLISYGISFHILITLALKKFLCISVSTTGNFRFNGSLDILVCLSFSPGT